MAVSYVFKKFPTVTASDTFVAASKSPTRIQPRITTTPTHTERISFPNIYLFILDKKQWEHVKCPRGNLITKMIVNTAKVTNRYLIIQASL